MLAAELPPLPRPSALAVALEESNLDACQTHQPHLHHLAIQVQHNLQHQHDWTSLQIHTHSPSLASAPSTLLPRPLVSGVPPQRIYIHPDDQIKLLKKGISTANATPEREWVLPTHLREKWSLKGLAEVFDCIPRNIQQPSMPPDNSGNDTGDAVGTGVGISIGAEIREKRVLLATLSDDTTIVYYIVHDGIVKPRQN
ncbi:MAG: hypothetical protein M1829_005112 [Trizodia sp. TS-e1964]|nr:MAG: hypothetical protein M1829_005112 [Trizodia sp. TS-e1964]